MSYFANSIASGAVWDMAGVGRFFRLLASAGAVRVEFYWQGSLKSGTDNVQAGFWRESAEPFDRVRITDQSGGVNALEIVIDSDHVGYDRMSISGTVGVQAKNGTPTQAAATVTNTAANLLAANANRRYLLIQNKDASGNIYVNLGGTTATAANGIKIAPGQSLAMEGNYCSAAAISAIGDIASNANIVTVEAS